MNWQTLPISMHRWFKKKSNVTVHFTVSDSNGKTVKRVQCHSFVANFLNVLYLQMAQIQTTGTFNMPNTANTSRGGFSHAANFTAISSAGNLSLGIVCGTGSTAIAQTDYRVDTLIAHGNSAGQLNYSSCTVNSPVVSGSTTSMTITRQVTNNSGSSITVNNVALYVRFYYYDISQNADACCIDHSLLTFTIANGAAETLTYTISVSC